MSAPGRIPRPPLSAVMALACASFACSLLTLPGPAPSPAAPPATAGPGVLLPPVTRASGAATALPGTPAPDEGTPVDSALATQLDQIESQVRSLRGLPVLHRVERSLLSQSELRTRIVNDLLADYTPQEAKTESWLLWRLDLLPPDIDLRDLYERLYAEQVAGYYDDEAGRMYVVTVQGFGGPERITYAHEYAHALQDQAFGLRDALRYSDEACQGEADRCRAVSALAEGDASLLETQWLRTYASQEDLAQILEYIGSLSTPVLDSAPAYIQADLLFPYEHGLAFAEDLYLDGRWSGVDAAYRTPPASTEHILHPERYPDDRPVRLDVAPGAADLPAGWTVLDRGTLGEWSLRQMLARHLSEEDAAATAQGWGGDSYVLYGADDRTATAVVLVAAWDTIRDAQEAFGGLRAYGDARFGSHGTVEGTTTWETAATAAILQRTSDQTLWILAPSLEIAQRLQAGLTLPVPHHPIPADEPSP